ncbi:MAG: type II toxin-antitoxin system HicA family toxin [Nitrososphaerales archaeon]
MSLPITDWREVLKALHKIGFNPVRQTGSHIILEHPDGRHTTVPKHSEIRRGLQSFLLFFTDKNQLLSANTTCAHP